MGRCWKGKQSSRVVRIWRRPAGGRRRVKRRGRRRGRDGSAERERTEEEEKWGAAGLVRRERDREREATIGERACASSQRVEKLGG